MVPHKGRVRVDLPTQRCWDLHDEIVASPRQEHMFENLQGALTARIISIPIWPFRHDVELGHSNILFMCIFIIRRFWFEECSISQLGCHSDISGFNIDFNFGRSMSITPYHALQSIVNNSVEFNIMIL